MQSMVIMRLLITSSLLLDRYSYHLTILDLQFAHLLSPRDKELRNNIIVLHY